MLLIVQQKVTNNSVEPAVPIFRAENNFLFEKISEKPLLSYLGYATVLSGRNVPTFRRNLLPLSSG
jgi:hypothetical protein